jgi:hypothetical protein
LAKQLCLSAFVFAAKERVREIAERRQWGTTSEGLKPSLAFVLVSSPRAEARGNYVPSSLILNCYDGIKSSICTHATREQ